ncbi:MAG: radical SAM protein [Kiritimatiellaeota bacterium]|nr:radical SAM protein [Kiritimatiellota bacterium]
MACRVLLINPPATRRAYLETNVRVGTPMLPSLGLAAIAGALRDAGHTTRFLDLDLVDVAGEPGIPGEPDISGKPVNKALELALREFNPDYCGITSITPTWHTAMAIARKVKQTRPATKVICGGVHASLFPEKTIVDGYADYVALGESDFTINELIATADAKSVRGLAYPGEGGMVLTPPRAPLASLDDLPMPDWTLFDKNRYRMSQLTERRRPGGFIETSRGCPFQCIYCNKHTFGSKFRAKSPQRVIAELDLMIRKHGFREIHIVDDGFSTDLDRAKEICRLIINSKLAFPFNLFNGIRADRLDAELAQLLKKAGCYQVAFGVESGSDRILQSVSKGLTTDAVRRAVALCKQHGLETFGFFMIGMPADTRESVVETIRFAVELEMTISKFDIAVPLPGTKMFAMLESEGRIRTKDWSRYIFHRTDEPLFDHPNMSWGEIGALYRLAYRSVYLRPRYIINRFWHGLRTGGLWHDLGYFLKTRWH